MATKSRFAGDPRWRQLRAQVRLEGLPCWICGLPIDYAAPQGAPLSFHLDELVPRSKGGGAERDNVAAAHACCNVWRSNRSVREVQATKAAVMQRRGGWRSPQDFVAKAKALKCGKLAARAKPTTTTEW